MPAPEESVNAFYRKIVNWSLFVHILSATTICLFVWGTVALLLRLTTHVSSISLLWGALGLPVAIGLAIRIARRRFPQRSAVRAFLDKAASCGGMLMAGAERELGDWQVSLPRMLPQIEWKWARPTTFGLVAAGYVVLSLLLPISRQLSAGAQFDLTQSVERVAHKLQVLKEEKLIDQERAENLKQKLEQIRNQAAGKDPARSLEALDQLNDILRKTARKAAEAAGQEAKSLSKVETAAEALQQVGGELEPSENAKRMKELGAISQKAAEESEKLNEELDSNLASNMAQGKLSSSDLAKLGAAAQKAKDKIKRLTRNLHNAKLIDADQLKECEGNCKAGAKELADYLKKQQGKGSLEDAMKDLASRGGTDDDGPRNTAMQFGEKSSAEGAKFREQALPPGSLSLKDSEMVGVGTATPQKDQQTSTPSSGELQNATAGGGSANAGAVLPQHRGAVSRYFERSRK